MKGMSTSPSSSTLPSDRTDILSRCKDTIEMLNETLEEERNHSQQLGERLRVAEEEVYLLREELSTCKNRHRSEVEKLNQQMAEKENKFQVLKEKLTSLVAANSDLLERNKLHEENSKKKEALAGEWSAMLAKFETDSQLLLEENAKLLSEREEVRLLVQQAFSMPANQQPPWSSQASATSMALTPITRDAREQPFLTQYREERLTQSVAGGPNTDESRASANGNMSVTEKITHILRSAAGAFEENERLRGELDGLHTLMEEHAGVMEATENEKQKMHADFTEQLNHMCHTIHELHKDIEQLTQDKKDLEEVADRMKEQLEEESINNDRLQRRLRIMREDKDDPSQFSRDQNSKYTPRGMNPQNSITTGSVNQPDKHSSKLIEILEKQLEERNSDLAEIRDRVKELEGVYRSELAAILMQGMHQQRQTSGDSSQVLGERRTTNNTENNPPAQRASRTTPKDQKGFDSEVPEQLLGRFRQVGWIDCR